MIHMPKISVIVPVCNVEKVLKNTLNSLMVQTLHDIEIICVDDFSKDRSKEILGEYASKDSRIKVIYHGHNLGTSQTRKDGVLVSKGKYIMFVDGDDILTEDACEVAFQAIEEYKTDMVQFGTQVVNCAGMPEARIQSNQVALEPYLERVEREKLVFACWNEKLFGFTLWNKIYNGALCRKAFSMVEDGYYPKAQDLYAFFIIAYLSKSYAGIEKRIYHYNFGLGVTGGDFITLNRFEILLTEKTVAEALHRFAEKQDDKDRLEEIIDGIENHFLLECINRWRTNLKPESVSVGFERLVDTWGFQNVICKLAEREWYNRGNVSEKMLEVDYFKHRKREKGKRLTIVAYYQSINNGGAQRVVAQLCNLWAEMKNEEGQPLYNIVLVTDKLAEETDYPLNPLVKREYVPNYEDSIKENYKERCEAWNRIISKHKIDIVVTSMWVAPCTLWDMLTIKGHALKPAFVIHSHSFCCVPYRFSGSTAYELMNSYQLCDGVITLSECDRRFVSTFSSNVKFILNPLTFLPDQLPDSIHDKNTVVWVGRLSAEKRPLDAIYMMSYVVKSIPNVKLYIVGSGNEELMERMENLIESLNLCENIQMVGFVQDVEHYYKTASVCVSTSEYEGFSLTICEALAYAVPVVTYDMPWLTLLQDGRGTKSVKQNRPDLLAEEVIRLLQSQETILKEGRRGKELVCDLANVDIAVEWKTFFDEIFSEKTEINEVGDEQILYRYLTLYQHVGKSSAVNSLNSKLQQTYEQKSEINRKLQITYGEKFERGVEIKQLKQKLRAIENSTTFKVGKIVMFLPIKVKCLLKKVLKR